MYSFKTSYQLTNIGNSLHSLQCMGFTIKPSCCVLSFLKLQFIGDFLWKALVDSRNCFYSNYSSVYNNNLDKSLVCLGGPQINTIQTLKKSMIRCLKNPPPNFQPKIKNKVAFDVDNG